MNTLPTSTCCLFSFYLFVNIQYRFMPKMFSKIQIYVSKKEYCIIKRNLSQLFVDHKIRKLEIRIKYLANMAYENSNSILHKSFCRLYLTRLTNYFFN